MTSRGASISSSTSISDPSSCSPLAHEPKRIASTFSCGKTAARPLQSSEIMRCICFFVYHVTASLREIIKLQNILYPMPAVLARILIVKSHVPCLIGAIRRRIFPSDKNHIFPHGNSRKETEAAFLFVSFGNFENPVGLFMRGKNMPCIFGKNAVSFVVGSKGRGRKSQSKFLPRCQNPHICGFVPFGELVGECLPKPCKSAPFGAKKDKLLSKSLAKINFHV